MYVGENIRINIKDTVYSGSGVEWVGLVQVAGSLLNLSNCNRLGIS